MNYISLHWIAGFTWLTYKTHNRQQLCCNKNNQKKIYKTFVHMAKISLCLAYS